MRCVVRVFLFVVLRDVLREFVREVFFEVVRCVLRFVLRVFVRELACDCELVRLVARGLAFFVDFALAT